MYPEFSVTGVKPEDVWQLFNVSNYAYYRKKVESLRKGECPFCQIDPEVNVVLYENMSWRLWKNTLAQRPGQVCQLLIPPKRHIERITDLTPQEWADLGSIIDWADLNLGVGGDGVLVVRTGDPSLNAKSVPHLHFNFHLPNGKDRVEVTIAKSEADYLKKLEILKVWEKCRYAEQIGDPFIRRVLTEEEWALVANTMEPPKTSR